MKRRRILALAAILAGVGTSSAQASDGIYWTNNQAPFGIWMISDQGGSNVPYSGYGWKAGAMGLAFDPANGRAYWSNPIADTIGWSNIDDDSGVGDLATPGVTLDHPSGIAIDAAAGRLYVANTGLNRISFVRLDGTGGGDLNTAGATLDNPYGLAVDPDGGRVYWSNNGGTKISYAKLDGTGGGDVNTGAVPIAAPLGVAVDPSAGRIYWASYGTGDIGWANLSGGGAGVLDRTGATPGAPSGLAIDAAAGRLVFGDISANKLSSAQLDGSGGADIPTAGDTLKSPFAVALLQVPRNTAPPTVSGAGPVGSTLTCDPGTWAPDITASFLFRAPHTLATTWSRNSSLIRNATTTLTTTQAGQYSCLVTGRNYAGASPQQTSAPVTVGGPGDPNPPGAISVQVTRITGGPGGGRVSIWTSVPGRVTITAGDKTTPITGRPVPAGDRVIPYKLTTSGKRTLATNGRLSIIFTVKLEPTAGGKTALTQRSILIGG